MIPRESKAGCKLKVADVLETPRLGARVVHIHIMSRIMFREWTGNVILVFFGWVLGFFWLVVCEIQFLDSLSLFRRHFLMTRGCTVRECFIELLDILFHSCLCGRFRLCFRLKPPTRIKRILIVEKMLYLKGRRIALGIRGLTGDRNGARRYL